ncbi:hypothetical protein JK169_01845 [Acetobacter persici]|uniref:hypothetical protein n=1 Tax=Acetobacter persici TaxID=1076596 RepID=UPI001BA8E764|nr:hypothetical protein [Acetobacter persici]MBS0999767.1 hypothetical protein [Acetobacter persici]
MTTNGSIPPVDFDIEALFAMFGALSGGHYVLEQLLSDRPDLIRCLQALSPQAVTAFGALLTIPEVQANSARIEAMIHLAIAHAQGKQSPSSRLAVELFDAIGVEAGHLEDPAEDLMIEAVRSPWGNYRIISGLWEGAGFFLQRFIDVVVHMPKSQEFERIRRSTIALLKLSEEICARANLERHTLGNEMPVGSVGKEQIAKWMRRRSQLIFTKADLKRLAIEADDLTPFVLTPADRLALISEKLGNTTLERRPLVEATDAYHLILPNAVTSAIRYWVIDGLTQLGLRHGLRRAISRSYAQLFHEQRLLGCVSRLELEFQPVGDVLVAETMVQFDRGRTIHFLFFTDTLDDFDKMGLSGVDPASAMLGNLFEQRIAACFQKIAVDSDYKEGMTLLVGCGVGRGVAIPVAGEDHLGWRVESCSANDLLTMSVLHDFSIANFWRILEARDRIRSLGLSLPNVNGLLNLVSWSRSLNGHLVPHGVVPDVPSDGGSMLLMAQNGLRELRHEAALETDFRMGRFVDGSWLRLRRDSSSVFDDDCNAPVYGSEDFGPRGMPMVAYVSNRRDWWADVESPAQASSSISYDRWRMANVWLSRSVPRLEERLALPVGPILWDLVFEGDLTDRRLVRDRLTYEAARAAVRVEVYPSQSTIVTRIGSDFDKALFHPENIAERALVAAFINGAARLAGEVDPEAFEIELLPKIVTDPEARHSHAFAQRGFRDYVRKYDGENKLIRITREDDAFTRLNLGWYVRDRSQGSTILGKAECTAFLNAIVIHLQDELLEMLKDYDRRQILELLLSNYELAIDDRDRWRLTSSALLALHGRKPSTFTRILDAEQNLSAIFQSTRILVEMAVCESPLIGGAIPGRLDLALLMAKATLLFTVGGWSDAVRWDVMKPEIHITSLGDIHANFDFFDEIIAPHVNAFGEVQIEQAVTSYASNLEERPTSESVEGELKVNFAEAWTEQIGATIDEVRLFIDAVEQIGIKENAKVICVERDRFKSLSVGDITIADATTARILEAFTLTARTSWRYIPSGFEERDRHPWRFRRQLSFLRRPILDWNPTADTFLLAPGMLRDSVAYMYSLYASGDFPVSQLSPKMAAWRATANGIRGTVFAEEVVDALRASGWHAEPEVKVTKLLGRGFDKDYGDVDVLAWRDDGRVLAIECKDVQFRKTLGEMAEQLADFRGKIRQNGKRDELRKHLDRMEIIREHLSQVASYVRLPSVTEIESHLLFRNPVPMEFALSSMAGQLHVSNFGEISSI